MTQRGHKQDEEILFGLLCLTTAWHNKGNKQTKSKVHSTKVILDRLIYLIVYIYQDCSLCKHSSFMKILDLIFSFYLNTHITVQIHKTDM